MNNDTEWSAAQAAEQNLISWERFVRTYCLANEREYSVVMKDPVLVEQLNIQWLRANKTDEQGRPI